MSFFSKSKRLPSSDLALNALDPANWSLSALDMAEDAVYPAQWALTGLDRAQKALEGIMQIRVLDFLAMSMCAILSRKLREACGLHVRHGLTLFSMLGLFQGCSV